MHHVRVQHVYQIGGSSSLRLIGCIVYLRSRWTIRSAYGDPVAVIGKEKSVGEIRSLVRRRGIQNPKLRRHQIRSGQSKIGREVAEHRRRIENILSERDSKTARRRAYQNAVAGRIEGAQQICN